MAPRSSRDVPSNEGLASFGTVSLAVFAVVACQVVAVVAGAQIGAILNACLVACLALAASAERGTESSRAAYLLFSLLPLLALARLAMPQNAISSDLWGLVVAAPIVAGSIAFVAVVDGGIFRGTRTPCSIRSQFAIASIWVPAGCLAFGGAYLLVEREDSSGIGVTTAIAVFLAGIFDELLFRGLLQLSLARIYGHSAFIVVALLYTAMLLGHSAVTVLLGGLLGLGFGFLVARWNALLAVAISHGVLNVVWLLLGHDLF